MIKIVRKVRPDWPREDIILYRLPSVAEAAAAAVTSFGAYTDNKGEAVMVRVYSEETRSALKNKYNSVTVQTSPLTVTLLACPK